MDVSTFQVLWQILVQVRSNICLTPSRSLVTGDWVRHYLLSAISPVSGNVDDFVMGAFCSQLIPAVIANVLVLRCIWCCYVVISPSNYSNC